MRNRILVTEGQGKFVETLWDRPKHSHREISVRAVMTGICRSDIDMMNGDFGPLPIHMQGHEGLGIVTKVGDLVDDVKVGDYAATRGEPAYADYYNCRDNEFVVVEELDPKYILEPVACGINCVVEDFQNRTHTKTLILGSGFLAWVVYNNLKHHHNHKNIN